MRARNTTAKPKTSTQGLSKASRPCEALAHEEMMGVMAPASMRLSFATMKFEPSKKVATAPPNSSGPRMPLRVRKNWNVRGPRMLPILFWNS